MAKNPVDTLYQTIFDMLQDLAVVFNTPDEQSDLDLVRFGYEMASKAYVMERTIKRVLPYKQQITCRDIAFFEENADVIFSGLPEEKIKHYTNAITKQKRISTEHMNVIWEYMDCIAILAEKHKTNVQ